MTQPSARGKILRRAALGLAGAALAIQLVPYGRAHSNPAVIAEPPWRDPATRALAVRACFDCHSNETHWPWYAHIAPMSWLLQNHVDEGRRALDFSDWPARSKHIDDAREEIEAGEMPPIDYRLIHASARLSADEKKQLIAGLEALMDSARR